jgi:hypothetical protein
MKLTLNKALAEGRLDEFIAQAEADGIGPASEDAMVSLMEALVKAPPRADRTSRSPARGGSRGR